MDDLKWSLNLKVLLDPRNKVVGSSNPQNTENEFQTDITQNHRLT